MTRLPERTCVGCRGKARKAELIRIARPPEGGMVADPSGKAHGRGAYVHRDAACLDLALEHGGLARALRASPPAEELARLRDEIERIVGS